MAPTDSANPRKRKQPAFKPPRPNGTDSGISKSKSKSKDSASARKSNIGSIFNEGPRKSKAKPKPRTKRAKQQAVLEEAELEEENDEDVRQGEDDANESLLDDEADASDAESGNNNDEDDDPEADSASDADMMLAELTHSPPTSSFLTPAIPLPLLHRILQQSFKTPAETKLSTDARACVGRYIETFIREGIARCAFEVGEKVHEVRSDSALGHDDGWVEVEDLERVGGQLVLDF